MSTGNRKIILKMEIKHRIGNQVTDRARVQVTFCSHFSFSASHTRSSLPVPLSPFLVFVLVNISLLFVLPRQSFYHRLLFNLLPTRLTWSDNGCDPLQEEKTSECTGNTDD